MELNQKDYNSKIEIYYQNEINHEFSKKIINNIWINDKYDENSFELIKDNTERESQVFRLHYKDKVYYLKNYFHKRISKRIENCLRDVEAVRHFKTSNKLLKVGIAVVKPVLALVFKRGLFKVDSIFVTEEFAGIDLDEYFKEYGIESIDKKLRLEIIKSMAQLWALLINNNFLHQDPTPDNFLIKFNKQSFELALVDVDNIYPLPLLPKRLAAHSLARFNTKLFYGLNKTDNQLLNEERILFFKEFLKNYKYQVRFKEFVNTVNKLTIKKLAKRDSKDLIMSDKALNDIYKKYNL